MTSEGRSFSVTALADNPLYKLVSGRRGWFLANPNDIYIGRAMLRYGELSELEWRVIDQLTPEGGNVIEVGANIGAHTVSLAKKTGQRGFVYAFEPQPIVFQNLCANLALNGLTNVQAVNAGCGGEGAEMLFPRIDYLVEGNFGGVSLPKLPRDRGGMVNVPIVRLDDTYPVDALALIKVDVEGMELPVLKGAQRLIEKFRPALYVENDRPENSEKLISLLFEFGYRLWWHRPPLFNPDNFAGESENLYERIVSTNMICIAKERHTNMGQLREVTSARERFSEAKT